jgi:hypothetical protein
MQVSGSVGWMFLYIVMALVAVIAIFGFAMRFVNSTKARGVQLKWGGRRPK